MHRRNFMCYQVGGGSDFTFHTLTNGIIFLTSNDIIIVKYATKLQRKHDIAMKDNDLGKIQKKKI